MFRRAHRILWLVGLIAMLAHLAMLTVGAVAMWQSRGAFEPHWSTIAPLTRVALWIEQAGWWFLALYAVLDLPMIVAYVRAARGRSYVGLFAGSLIIRAALLIVGATATTYLASLGRVQIETTRFGGTWRVFQFSDVLNQTGGHALLSIPLVIFAARWLPLLWSPHRRRLNWARRGCCLACGYDPRASDADRCPECGNTRVANLALPIASR